MNNVRQYIKQAIVAVVLTTPLHLSAAVDPMFENYIALGDSIAHGMQGNAVEKSRQQFSHPSLLAKSMQTKFTQAIIRFPGTSKNKEDELKGKYKWYHAFDFYMGGIREDGFKNQSQQNNYAVSGATLKDVIYTTGLEGGHYYKVLDQKNESALDQALQKNPTFISITVGTNDVMNHAVSNRLDDMPSREAYREMLEELATRIKATASVSGVVISNVADIFDFPIFVPAESDGYPEGSMKFYIVKKATHEDMVATPDEIKRMKDRTIVYNEEIKKIAEANNWALVNNYQFVKDGRVNGHYLVDENNQPTSRQVTMDYLGGIISLDGLHPSSIGQAIIANAHIQAINHHYGKNLTNGAKFSIHNL